MKYRVHLSWLLLLGVFATFLPPASAALNDDLNPYYTFDDVLTNSVNASYDGVWVGSATYGPGFVNNGVDLDTGRYVNITDKPSYLISNFANDWSFSFWMRPRVINQNKPMLGATTGVGTNALIFDFITNGSIRLYNNGDWRDFSHQFTVNDTYFITVTHDSVNSRLFLFVNGTLEDSIASGGNTITTGDVFLIGSRSVSPTVMFDGVIDEFSVYSRNITNTEIQELYDNLKAGNQYPFSAGPRYLEFTAADFYTAAAINTFNVTFTNGSFFSTTDGNITLVNWTNGNYTATVRSPNYVSNTSSFEHINITSVSYSLLPNNDLAFIFRDEENDQTIENISFVLYSNQTGYSVSGNTTNGSLQIQNLAGGLYTLEYENTQGLYRGRNYFIYIPLQTFGLYNTTLYLLNESTGDPYLPRVVDENDVAYPHVFQALRWYSNGDGTGEYRVVESSQVDAQGLAAMFLEFNTASYTFRAINIETNTIDESFNTPKQLFSQSETYRVTFQEGFYSLFDALGTLKSTNIAYFNTTTQYYEFQWTTKPSNVVNICLEVMQINGPNQNVTRTCGYADSGTLIYTFNSTNNPGLYMVTAWANSTSNVRYTLATREDSFISGREYPTGTIYRNAGLAAGIFVAIAGAFVAVETPIVGLIVMIGGVGLLSSVALNILPFGAFFLVTMFIVAFIIAVVIKK